MNLNKNILLFIIIVLSFSNLFLIYNQWKLKEQVTLKLNKLSKDIKKLEVEHISNSKKDNKELNVKKKIVKDDKNITNKMYEQLEKIEKDNLKENLEANNINSNLEQQYYNYKEDFNNNILSDNLKKEIENLEKNNFMNNEDDLLNSEENESNKNLDENNLKKEDNSHHEFSKIIEEHSNISESNIENLNNNQNLHENEESENTNNIESEMNLKENLSSEKNKDKSELSHEHLLSLTVKELQQIARENKLIIRGKKNDLLERIANHLNIQKEHVENKNEDENEHIENKNEDENENEHVENKHVENEHVENEHVENEYVENKHVENEHVENEHVENKNENEN